MFTNLRKTMARILCRRGRGDLHATAVRRAENHQNENENHQNENHQNENDENAERMEELRNKNYVREWLDAVSKAKTAEALASAAEDRCDKKNRERKRPNEPFEDQVKGLEKEWDILKNRAKVEWKKVAAALKRGKRAAEKAGEDPNFDRYFRKD